jgi:hypothetical protein
LPGDPSNHNPGGHGAVVGNGPARRLTNQALRAGLHQLEIIRGVGLDRRPPGCDKNTGHTIVELDRDRDQTVYGMGCEVFGPRLRKCVRRPIGRIEIRNQQ